jgi:hypothetical protein
LASNRRYRAVIVAERRLAWQPVPAHGVPPLHESALTDILES